MVRHVSASIFGHQWKFQENWWPKIDANFGKKSSTMGSNRQWGS